MILAAGLKSCPEQMANLNSTEDASSRPKGIRVTRASHECAYSIGSACPGITTTEQMIYVLFGTKHVYMDSLHLHRANKSPWLSDEVSGESDKSSSSQVLVADQPPPSAKHRYVHFWRDDDVTGDFYAQAVSGAPSSTTVSATDPTCSQDSPWAGSVTPRIDYVDAGFDSRVACHGLSQPSHPVTCDAELHAADLAHTGSPPQHNHSFVSG